jgi:acetyltransferase-like isoleucine patch superfamily enzyme
MASPVTAEPADAAAGRLKKSPGTQPPPLRGNVFTLLRFMKSHGMWRRQYFAMLIRLGWHKARLRKRLELDGVAFIRPGVRLDVGSSARLKLGRWVWIGEDTKIRVNEGQLSIGAKSVLGQECTMTCYQHISIGRECMVADRTMIIDFDHITDDVEQSIRRQGIRKRDVRIGHNVWIGYGVCVLRGVSVGDNCVVGAASVLTCDAPPNAVLAGSPARVIRERPAPATLRFD